MNVSPIRDRDRVYAIAFVIAMVVLGLVAVLWFGTTFLDWIICPCG